MKIYVIADMEGIAGVVSAAQTGGESWLYEAARQQYTREIRAVCEAAISAGAEEVYVNDFHGNGLNVQAETLPREVMVIKGGFRPTSGYELLDETFSGVVMLGVHARTGTYGGVIPHTYSNKLFFELFGQPVGEFDILALIAGEKKVPIILISGDSKSLEQAGTNLPSTPAVITKYSVGTEGALCMHPDRVCELLRDEVKRALKMLDSIEPAQSSGNIQLQVTVADVCLSSRLEWIPGLKRLDDRRFEYVGHSMQEIINIIYGCSTLVEAKF
jgi:D-amino peptidase